MSVPGPIVALITASAFLSGIWVGEQNCTDRTRRSVPASVESNEVHSWHQYQAELAARDCRIVEWKFVKQGERAVVFPNGGSRHDTIPMIPLWVCYAREHDTYDKLTAKGWHDKWRAQEAANRAMNRLQEAP